MNDFLLLFIHVILSMVLPAGLSLTVGGGVNYRIVILSYLWTVCVWRNPFRFVVLNDTNVFRIHCDGPRDKDAVPTCSLSSIRFGGQKKMVPVTAKKREEEEEKKELTDKARARSIGPLERQVVSADANPRAVGLPTAAGVHPATSRRAIFSTCCFAYFQIENKTTHIM